MSTDFYSSSYAEARERFREAARAVGASIESLTVDASEDLTIDACMIGSDSRPTVMVTSGVHGVEGFFGSASQLALLDRLRKQGQTASTARPRRESVLAAKLGDRTKASSFSRLVMSVRRGSTRVTGECSGMSIRLETQLAVSVRHDREQVTEVVCPENRPVVEWRGCCLAEIDPA